MGRIAVVGSVNIDMVATGPKLPRPGETVTDAVFAMHPGGKGANQALAIKRLGGDPVLVAKVGTGGNADLALSTLRHDGVDLDRAWRDADHPTGVALIVVDGTGENQIVVAPGANRHLHPEDLDLRGCDTVLAQLEIPIETALAAARGATGRFILNAAPAREIPDELLALCDVVIVNQTEADILGSRLADSEALIIKTLGSEGAVATQRGVEVGSASAPVVEPVDTVGAGDTFAAAFVVASEEGMSIAESLRWACGAGALATLKHGAQPGIPTRHELVAFMEDQ